MSEPSSTTICNLSTPQEIASGSFAYSQMICETSRTTSTNQTIANGFTYGEIVQSVLLFLIFAVVLYNFLWFSLHRHLKMKQQN